MTEAPDKIKVAVRVRPLNRREIDMKTPICVDMENNQTILYPSNINHQKSDKPILGNKTFAFDESFWSIDSNNEKFSSQEKVFERLGVDVIEQAFSGYNACIFAYGQTGSGKSYTMLGTSAQPGIIPRLCNRLFEEISKRQNSNTNYKIEVSYMEIYNEKVRDLLDVQGQRKALRVREHNILGPYVDGLSLLVVSCLSDIEKLMNEGNKSRTVAATNMNTESSRSHAVFNIILTETLTDPVANVSGEKMSKISLVDLAGSERTQKTGAVGERLREGCNINKSLTTLMQVISALASASTAVTSNTGKENRGKSASKTPFVPYRDSTLTWLLKDNLGGNSKTVMVATLSPAADNYEETLSTLRYADNAKRIVNHAVVNEDPNAKIIRELREQVEGLKRELENAKEMQAPGLKEKLQESEHIIKELSKTWEEKLIETERKHKERQEALEKMGISVETSGIKVEKSKFFLVNLNADPSLNEMLVYYLKDTTAVGRGADQDIKLHGILIQEQHCIIELQDDLVFLTPFENARTVVNGNQITERTQVHHNDRILWGKNHWFRINCPKKTNLFTSSDCTDSNMSGSREIALNDEFQLANEEVMRAELANDPMQMAILDLEKHLMAEKEEALKLQKQEFERQLENLKGQLSQSDMSQSMLRDQNSVTESTATSPLSTSGTGINNNNLMSMSQYTDSMMHLPSAFNNNSLANQLQHSQHHQLQQHRMSMDQDNSESFWPSTIAMPSWMGSQTNLFATPNNIQLVQAKYQTWVENRERSLALMLQRLREKLAKANSLTREANFIADEMAKSTEYSVTLQIPSVSLNPNGKNQSGIISEPAILVKRDNKPNQIWSLEKLENKVIEMRELYEDWKDTSCPNRMPLGNPFNQHNDVNASGEEIIKDDAFFDAQENHSLIGVANIYLTCLFQKVKFRYQVPIINQQGEISGKLAVELSVINGELPDLTPRDNTMTSSIYNPAASSMSTSTSNTGMDYYHTDESPHSTGIVSARSLSGYSLGSSITVRIRVIQATHLPEHLSHFVFCQYSFWGAHEPIVVPPALQPDYVQRQAHYNNNVMSSVNGTGVCTTFKFNHTQDLVIPLSDDVIEQLAEGALSIEVFGNHSPGFSSDYELSSQMSRSCLSDEESVFKQSMTSSVGGGVSLVNPRRFGDRWMELYRRLEFWVCIEELNEQGDYQKVELEPNSTADEIATGGVFQLRHGQAKRIRVFVRPNKVSRGCRGSLPLICDQIDEISIGDIFLLRRGETIQSESTPPDSYQEEDLTRLRDAWSRAITNRQEYLKEQLQKVSNNSERESSLMNQWLRLTEERNAVLVPAPGSGIPGAPATWSPVVGMEKHCPVIFLDIDNSEMTNAGGAAAINDPGPVPCAIDHHGNVTVMAGGNCLLPGSTTESNFLVLPVVKRYENLCGAVGQWDASLHDNKNLNRVTAGTDRVYLTVKVVVRLNHPVLVDLVLRKRICINIFKKQGFTNFLKKQWKNYKNESHSIWSGVTYQIVSGIPQNSLEFEDRETLAKLAANQSADDSDQETYIQKYIRTVSTVESLMEVDRIRQEVACQEIVAQMRRQRRSIQPNPDPLIIGRRQPIIGNPGLMPNNNNNNNIMAIPGVAPSMMILNPQMNTTSNLMAGMKKYISVPDFQQMYRSSSLTNLNSIMNSDPNNNFSSDGKDIQQSGDFETLKSGSISNLSKLVDNSMSASCYTPSNNTTASSNTTNANALPIKPALVPKRPQPPKNLLMLGKTSHMTGVVPTSNGQIQHSNNNNNNSYQQADQHKTPTNNHQHTTATDAVIATTTSSVNPPSIAPDTKLSHSTTEDSLTRSKSSGYGSSQTVCSNKHNNMTPLVAMLTNNIGNNNNANLVKSLYNTKVWCVVNGDRLSGYIRHLDNIRNMPDSGLWVGIELDECKGTNDGSIKGVRYFSSHPQRGIFVRPDNVLVEL